jgi:hypothetical protein
MNVNHHWFTVKQLIDRHGRVTTIIPDNLSPHEAQHIMDIIESTRYVQESFTDSLLSILVPEVDYNPTPLILNDIEVEERPNLFVQRSNIDPINSDTSVPDVTHNVIPLISDDLALEEPDLSVQELYTDSAISDTFVPDVNHNMTPLILNDLSEEQTFIIDFHIGQATVPEM